MCALENKIQFPLLDITTETTDVFVLLYYSDHCFSDSVNTFNSNQLFLDCKGDVYKIIGKINLKSWRKCIPFTQKSRLLFTPVHKVMDLDAVKYFYKTRFSFPFTSSTEWATIIDASKSIAECIAGKEYVIACMEYPLLDISVNSWDINCLCDTILLDCTMNANEYQNKYHQHIVMDCKGVVFTIKNWKSGGWKSLLPWRKNAQLLFDTTASIMTLDEVKTFLIGKLHLLQTADKEACEGYITNLTTIRNVVVFWSFYVQGKVDFGK